MLHYDNLDDVKTKLMGTFVYHKGKAVICKDATVNDKGQFLVLVQGMSSRQRELVNIEDPELNFMRYNIGYSNHNVAGAWWYRMPNRQYRQGLKGEQVRPNVSNEGFAHMVEFNFNRPIVEMLENKYPKFEEIEKSLKDGNIAFGAFHKDFACTWDKVHKDYILEYKGRVIGCLHSLKKFELMDEYKHLTEAFKEAVA